MPDRKITHSHRSSKLDRFCFHGFVLPDDDVGGGGVSKSLRMAEKPHSRKCGVLSSPIRKVRFVFDTLNSYCKSFGFSGACSCNGFTRSAETLGFHDAAGTNFVSCSCFENPRIFSYAELYIGSNGFSGEEVIGIGGFGKVYRAVLPSDGTVVAVKCGLEENGTRFEKTFAAELAAVANLRHRNLLRLRGWSVQDDRLLLVYDYMPNRSLDRVLFYNREDIKRKPLEWERRRAIVAGLASALHYLHHQLERQIIHRDVKTSNVLLDSHFVAKLGDFGLARWLEHDSNSQILSRSTRSTVTSSSMESRRFQFHLADTSRIGGTIGYLPPESFQKRNSITAKSDVFSFGIVVLEIVSGRRAVDLSCSDDRLILLDYARKVADDGGILEIRDDRLTYEDSEEEDTRRLIHVGLLCTMHDPASRPDMKWIVGALSGNVSGELPSLPSFHAQPLYISLSTSDANSSSTNTNARSITVVSSNYATAPGETIYYTAENKNSGSSGGGGSRKPIGVLPIMETPRDIPYSEIIEVTENFSESRRISELDFGTSYRGILGENKNRVMIKRYGWKTCPALRARFSKELNNLKRLRHRNLVQLRGWCTERGELIVVYDHSENQLLRQRLFDRTTATRHLLRWNQRYSILKSLASAILYLHEEWEEQVIHRNITTSAVILDRELSPRLSSFAMAEFLTRNETGEHVPRTGRINSVRGIFGYMSPEYMESGEATPESDVYSFGVVVLEVVTGQMAVDFRRPEVLLVKKIRELLYEKGKQPIELIDPKLEERYVVDVEAIRLVKLGTACTSSVPGRRPAIRNIVKILDGDGEDDDLWKEDLFEKDKYSSSLSLVRRMQALGID